MVNWQSDIELVLDVLSDHILSNWSMAQGSDTLAITDINIVFVETEEDKSIATTKGTSNEDDGNEKFKRRVDFDIYTIIF